MADEPSAAYRPPSGRRPPTRTPAPPSGDDWTAEDVLSEAAANPTGSPDVDDATAIPDPATWLPALEGRSTTPDVCPFLRGVGPDAAIGLPIETPDVANRCAALREPVPQSLRQQELVCLTSGHINCPRYLRGALIASEAPRGRIRAGTGVTPAITVALAVLALSFGVSVAFVVANGGLTLPVAANVESAPPSAAAIESSAEPGAGATPGASGAATIVPASPVPPAIAPAPIPSPSATAEPTPEPTKTAKPKPSSNRYALLKPCPDKPRCWIYVIRSGDNLFSIANYFGVSLERVKALNPWTLTERLRAGRELILPPPTR